MTQERTEAPEGAAEPASFELPERWKAFEALRGRTWETHGDSPGGRALRTRSTFAWLPSLEMVFARALALDEDGEPTSLLEAYEGDRVASQVVQLDFEIDGNLRTRTWSLAGAERTLTLNIRHRPLEPKQD